MCLKIDGVGEQEGWSRGKRSKLQQGRVCKFLESWEIKPEREWRGWSASSLWHGWVNCRLCSWVLPRPWSLGATERGLPAVVGEITLFKQMECERCLPYANEPHLISSLPAMQFKMSQPPEGVQDESPRCLEVISAPVQWLALVPHNNKILGSNRYHIG